MSWNLPDGQWKQAVFPVHAWYVPLSQGLHDSPDAGWYLPFAHGLHCASAFAPAGENLPAWQCAHAAALVLALYLPAAQSWHDRSART